MILGDLGEQTPRFSIVWYVHIYIYLYISYYIMYICVYIYKINNFVWVMADFKLWIMDHVRLTWHGCQKNRVSAGLDCFDPWLIKALLKFRVGLLPTCAACRASHSHHSHHSPAFWRILENCWFCMILCCLNKILSDSMSQSSHRAWRTSGRKMRQDGSKEVQLGVPCWNSCSATAAVKWKLWIQDDSGSAMFLAQISQMYMNFALW